MIHKKILLIEDDFDIGEIVKMTLDSKFNVLLKPDSKQLLTVINQFMPDVIIIDNFIGQENAKEILEKIKTEGFNLAIPIILFSAHQSIKQIAKEIGAADFIAKPFNLDELENCVNRVLLSAELKQ